MAITDPALQQAYKKRALDNGVPQAYIDNFLKGDPNDYHRIETTFEAGKGTGWKQDASGQWIEQPVGPQMSPEALAAQRAKGYGGKPTQYNAIDPRGVQGVNFGNLGGDTATNFGIDNSQTGDSGIHAGATNYKSGATLRQPSSGTSGIDFNGDAAPSPGASGTQFDWGAFGGQTKGSAKGAPGGFDVNQPLNNFGGGNIQAGGGGFNEKAGSQPFTDATGPTKQAPETMDQFHQMVTRGPENGGYQGPVRQRQPENSPFGDPSESAMATKDPTVDKIKFGSALEGVYTNGQFNQGIVDRRSEIARENLDRFRKSQGATDQAALAERGLAGSGAEQTAQHRMNSDIADQYGSALSGIIANESENADSRMMQGMGIAKDMSTAEAQAAIDKFRANTDRGLGVGNLDLGNRRLGLDSELGKGKLSLDAQLGNRGLDIDREKNQGELNLGQNRLKSDDALGHRKLGIDETLGQGTLNLGQNRLKSDDSLGHRQLDIQDKLGSGRLDLDKMLGQGNLALGNMNGQNNYNLGLGQQGLERDRLLHDIQNGDQTALLKLIELMQQGAGQSAGGYVGGDN